MIQGHPVRFFLDSGPDFAEASFRRNDEHAASREVSDPEWANIGVSQKLGYVAILKRLRRPAGIENFLKD